ncbi:hypothetical protein [Thalassotalea sp. Y01]|uniref:hypothetical protein n=1 Tax=Thalassotalea sp. Y01 TaxID=2729613 RepID=UPI001B7D63C8|nr:hypothetical protein [Thalassotalea sp. Y01]
MTRLIVMALCCALFYGCGTSDSELRQAGYDQSYVQGFHDGRHSGLQEAGNNYESYIRDEEKFNSDDSYKQGWLAGEAEGKKLQAQATSIGEGVAGAYSSEKIKQASKDSTDPEKAAKEVIDKADKEELKKLK